MQIQVLQTNTNDVEFKNLPDFAVGDTIIVNLLSPNHLKITPFEGICVGRYGDGINENITVRSIATNNTIVERGFSLSSSDIKSIVVRRQGISKRSKLYYLRNRFGKIARINELSKTVSIEKTAIERNDFATQTNFVIPTDITPFSLKISAIEAKNYLVKLGTHNADGTLSQNYSS